MSDTSAFQDLMTYVATRRPDAGAADDEAVILAALAKYGHEVAEELRTRFTPQAQAASPWADGWMSAASHIYIEHRNRGGESWL